MYKCSNCNANYQVGGYCANCGTLLTEVINNDNPSLNQMNFNTQNNVQHNDPLSNGYANNITDNNQNVALNNYNQNTTNNNFNSVVKKDDKKYAIISIIIGALAIFIYIFVGLSVWLALIICSIGISLANKSKNSSPSLSKAGVIINTILGVIAIIMWILLIIGLL